LCHSRKAKIEAQNCNLEPIKVRSFIFAPVTKIYSQKVENEAPKVFQRAETTLNGSGVRDIARVLDISPTTVIQELKKTPLLLSSSK
jgi:hypothetical protein